MKIVSAILAVITVIISFFNKEQEAYYENKNLYFKNVLLKFYERYKSTANINVVDFIKNNYSHEDNYIPQYIWYLVYENEKEKLVKILLKDYVENRISFESTISKMKSKVFRQLAFLEYFFVIIVLFLIFYSIIVIFASGTGIQHLYRYNDGVFNFKSMLTDIIGTSVFIGAMFLINWCIASADDYTLKKKKIIKKIDDKVKKYDKEKHNYYL